MSIDPNPLTPTFTRRELDPLLRRALMRFAFVGMMPIAFFYVAYRVAGPIEGMLVGTVAAAAALVVQAVRMHRLDPIGIVPIGAVLIQGTAGIAFQSVDLYLAAPALETSLWGMALLGSVLVRRPIILLAASELGLLPVAVRRLPTVRCAFRQLTIIWGLVSFVKAGTRLALLSALPLEMFLVTNTLVITSMNLLLLAFSMWHVARAVRAQTALAGLAVSSV